jgi:hypothetical protein
LNDIILYIVTENSSIDEQDKGSTGRKAHDPNKA